MTLAKIDKLVRMANQIGDAFSAAPEAEAIENVATHLKRFWTPKMIRELVAFADAGHAGLSANAASAVAALKKEVSG